MRARPSGKRDQARMANISLGDVACDRLRTLIATIEGEIARLPATGDGTALHASWSELVKVLALGAQPELRECPVCHGSGFRAASRCSSCWSKLEPLAAAATVTDAPRSQV